MKVTNEKTKEIKVFELENGFVLEVEAENAAANTLHNFWLYHQGYGVKVYLFGMTIEGMDIVDFVKEFVKNNIDEYVDSYIETYLDGYLPVVNDVKGEK